MDYSTLEKAGYRKYRSHKEGTILFQKFIRDDKGKKYFIDVYEWDWTKFQNRNPPKSYEVIARLYKKDTSIDITIHVYHETLEEVEELIEETWTKLGCEYDLYNQ